MNTRLFLRASDVAQMLGMHPSVVRKLDWFLRESFRTQGVRGRVVTPVQVDEYVRMERANGRT